MSLETCIQKIVDGFNHGEYFDSHTVINELIANKEYHLEYLRGYSENMTVAQYHGQIAQEIKATNKCELISKEFKSHTIYGELSTNALWKKN